MRRFPWTAVGVVLAALWFGLSRLADPGATPGQQLVEAVLAHDAQAVRHLLEGGADPDTLDSRGDVIDMPVLALAAHFGDAEVARALLAGGAQTEPAGTEYRPMESAAAQGHADVVALLAAHGARIDVRDRQGATPLAVAAWAGHLDTVTELARLGADVNAANDAGLTPLMFAAGEGHAAVVAFLLTQGANPAARSADGATAIDLARERGQASVVALLER